MREGGRRREKAGDVARLRTWAWRSSIRRAWNFHRLVTARPLKKLAQSEFPCAPHADDTTTMLAPRSEMREMKQARCLSGVLWQPGASKLQGRG